ncbi:MAG: tetratricopeptide repeat protein [Thermodesulfobacteriota bacterium]
MGTNMMAWRKRGYGLAFSLAVMMWAGIAVAAPAASELEQAIGFYRQGAYPEAARLLERVTRQEPQNGAAHFFAGLTRQAQGDYAGSIPSFQAAMRHDREFAQLATYQIGLAQHKLGKRQEAVKELRQAVAMDPASDAGKNARALLDTLGQQRGEKAATSWHVRLGLGFEYDDNLTVEEQDLATDQSDFATVLELEGGYRLAVPKPYQAELSYGFYQSLYDDYSQFDLQTHTLGLSGSRDFEGWEAGLAYAYSYMFLGREGFLQSHRLTPNVGFSLPHDLYATVSYTLEDKDFRKTADNGRDAVNQAVGGDLFAFFMENRGYLQLGYRLEGENAATAEYDYWGQTLVAAVQVPAWYETRARLSFKYQDREYRHVTPSIGAERDDIKQTLGFLVSRRFLGRYDAKAEYQYIDSDSNLESSDYSQNVFFVGVSASF